MIERVGTNASHIGRSQCNGLNTQWCPLAAVAWAHDGLLLFTDEADNSVTQIDTNRADPAAPEKAVVVSSLAASDFACGSISTCGRL